MSTHECPGGTCQRRVPVHQLACPDDWRRLPKPMQTEVNAAFRARRTDPLRHRNAVTAALAWYRENT